jgi:hypothetical protein
MWSNYKIIEVGGFKRRRETSTTQVTFIFFIYYDSAPRCTIWISNKKLKKEKIMIIISLSINIPTKMSTKNCAIKHQREREKQREIKRLLPTKADRNRTAKVFLLYSRGNPIKESLSQKRVN